MVVNNEFKRRLVEELEMLKKRQKALNNLMNIKINFENDDISYNTIKK